MGGGGLPHQILGVPYHSIGGGGVPWPGQDEGNPPPMVRTGRGYPLPSQVGVLPSTPGDTRQVLGGGVPL